MAVHFVCNAACCVFLEVLQLVAVWGCGFPPLCCNICIFFFFALKGANFSALLEEHEPLEVLRNFLCL